MSNCFFTKIVDSQRFLYIVIVKPERLLVDFFKKNQIKKEPKPEKTTNLNKPQKLIL